MILQVNSQQRFETSHEGTHHNERELDCSCGIADDNRLLEIRAF